MAPATWLGVLLFVLFIAPGLLFDLLTERRRTGASESTFREISRVVLASIAFSGAGLAILLALRQLFMPGWLIDPDTFVRDGARYASGNYQVISLTLVLGVSIALALAIISHFALARGGGARIRKRSAWTRVFKDDRPKNTFPYARIRLDDGSIYSGRVQDFTADLELDDRELVLRPPFLRAKIGDGALTALPDYVERVVISGSKVQALSVIYWPEQQPESAPTPTPTPE